MVFTIVYNARSEFALSSDGYGSKPHKLLSETTKVNGNECLPVATMAPNAESKFAESHEMKSKL